MINNQASGLPSIYLLAISISFLEGTALSASAPSNDDFANRAPLTGVELKTSASNVGATVEVGEPTHANHSRAHSVWWSWTAPANGWVSITVGGGGFYKTLAVYTGLTLAELKPVQSDGGWWSKSTCSVGFDCREGEVYQIAVDGRSPSDAGNLELSLRFTAATKNDEFSNRTLLLQTLISLFRQFRQCPPAKSE